VTSFVDGAKQSWIYTGTGALLSAPSPHQLNHYTVNSQPNPYSLRSMFIGSAAYHDTACTSRV